MKRKEVQEVFEGFLDELFSRLEGAVQRGVVRGMQAEALRRGDSLPASTQESGIQPADGAGVPYETHADRALAWVRENPGTTMRHAKLEADIPEPILYNLERQGKIRKEGAYPARFYPVDAG